MIWCKSVGLTLHNLLTVLVKILRQGMRLIFTWWFCQVNLHDRDQAGIKVICFWLLSVENFHWVCPTRDGEDGGLIEVLRELYCIQGS